MNVTITNLGPVAVPFASTDHEGFVQSIEPNEAATTNDPEVVIASVGDNPTLREEFDEGREELRDGLVKLVTLWREHRPEGFSDDADPVVKVSIFNRGQNALRVLLGSNTNEWEVRPGQTFVAEAPGYVEIRELGV